MKHQSSTGPAPGESAFHCCQRALGGWYGAGALVCWGNCWEKESEPLKGRKKNHAAIFQEPMVSEVILWQIR